MLQNSFNYRVKVNQHTCVLIEDVATKIGSLFGEKGRDFGRKIDKMTKDITIEQDLLSYNRKRHD